jgi:hypothetical protein
MKPIKKKKPGSDKDELIANAIDALKQGYSVSYVKSIMLEIPQDKYDADEIIAEATRIISEDHLTKAADIKLLHLKRYDRTITRLLSTTELSADLIDQPPGKGGITYERWLASRNKKIKAYNDCIDTMQQKENLMQLFTNTLTIDENQDITFKMAESKPEPKFNISRLSFKESLELSEIFKKAKVGENEPLGVREVNREENFTQAVVTEAEVLPANIEQIQQVQLPALLIDNVTTDPLLKLKARIKIMAAQKILEAGGHLDEEEKRLLDDSNNK